MLMLSKLLKSVELFKGIATPDLQCLLTKVGAAPAHAKKGTIILLAGDQPKHMGIVLTGQVHTFRENYDGSRSLLAVALAGDVFAESMYCAGLSKSLLTLEAAADSTIMLLDFLRILRTCPNSCPSHAKLVENMLRLIAGRNLMLQHRMGIISLKSIRAKVMRYLESLAPKQSRDITIPFNREELANYLCVERSALSHELARMRKDGLIDYKKNVFTLK